jgi:hypothetical protein
MIRILIEPDMHRPVNRLISTCLKWSVQRVIGLTMAEGSKSPSPEKLSPQPEADSLLSQPVNN